MVPIKAAEAMTFTQFWTAYEQVVRKSRTGSLTAEDYAGTTISLTNPGGIGTNHSVPRLMTGQTAIIGVGALEYPAEFQGASGQTLAELGISKIITLTSTYDHRVIQGAESGEFLKRVHQLLLGEDGFYDDIFTSLRLPYEPVRWVTDLDQGRAGNVDRTSRVLEIIDAYRTRGHLMADTDPLNYRQRRHPDLDIITHGLTLWDLDREFPVGGFNGATVHEAPRRPRGAPRRLLPHRRRRIHAHPRPRPTATGSNDGSRSAATRPPSTSRPTSSAGSTARKHSSPSCKPNTSDRNGSPWKAARPSSRCWTPRWPRPPNTAPTRPSSGWPTAAGSTCWPTSSASPTR